MPVPAPDNLLYLRWVFRLMSGVQRVEDATFGLYALRYHVPGNDVDWDTDVVAMAAKLRDAWVTTMTPAAGMFSNSVYLDHVDCYQIGRNGKVASKGQAGAASPNNWAGTSTKGLPFQCALAVSTQAYEPSTFVQDRQANQGRFFLPPLGEDSLDPDGRLNTAAQTQFMTLVGSFLNEVQGAEFEGTAPLADPDYVDLQIYSTQQDKGPRLEGVTAPLTWFRIGRVIDTQRRRRRDLAEAYAAGEVEHAN